MRHPVERFERFVYVALIVFLVVLLFFMLLELGWMVAQGIFDVSVYRLESGEVFGLLGHFLLVLIGLELLETIRAYLDRREFHVEIVILVAIIAIARKVILLESPDTGELIGIALIIIALCGGYYLVHRAGMPRALPPDDGTAPSGRREAP